MTSRAWAWDLVESIGEDIALSSHIQEKLDNSEDEEEIKNLKLMKKEVLDSRREKMSYLLEQGEKPNPLYWCIFKHSLGAYWRDTEVYEATLKDEDLERVKKSLRILAMSMSLFLGMEFEVCARCLGDKILVKESE